jgi:hypothetical protein
MNLFKFLQFLGPTGMNQVAEGNIMDNENTMNGTQPFSHNDFSLKFCPEAQGHFCMLWGDHGHGGYDSTSGLYAQGGQPMDEIFELAGFYIDFNEAKANGDWQSVRKAAMAIRDMRTQLGIDKTEEKLYRKNLF